MEYGIVIIFTFLFVWFLYNKKGTQKGNPWKSKNDLIKIDDENYIVNGERVSFEEDTPLLRHQQEVEDKKHYREYERVRLAYDREKIYEEWRRTTQFIDKHPDWSSINKHITKEDLEKIAIKYSHYLKMCDKLQEKHFMLNKEEFIIKETNVIACCSFKMMSPTLGCSAYVIHNEKTAKYAGGNVMEQIRKEFKEKWY